MSPGCKQSIGDRPHAVVADERQSCLRAVVATAGSVLMRFRRTGALCAQVDCSNSTLSAGRITIVAEKDLALDAAIPGFKKSDGKGGEKPTQLDVTTQGQECRALLRSGLAAP